MSSLLPKLVACIALTTLTVLVPSVVAAPRHAAKKPAPPAGGCQRFAAPRGHDSNRGTPRSPFATVERLVRALKPGETGCLQSGRYRGDVHLRTRGRRGAVLTLRAAPGASATICGFVEFKRGGDYWRLTQLHVDGSCSSQNTIQIYADHSTLDHLEITNQHRAQSCVLIGTPRDGRPRETAVHHSRIHDCGHAGSHWQHGIYASSPRNARITDNYVYANAGFGIHLYSDAQSTLVERNVVDGSSTESGLVFGGAAASASSHNLVKRNIFSGNGKYGASSSWDGPVGEANVLSANCFWQNGYGAFPATRRGFVARRNVEADPRFIAASAGNYRLLPRSRCRAMQPRGHVGPNRR
jgi:parallel beta-helix repeat protein